MPGLQTPFPSVGNMDSMYLCPLSTNSKFCMSKLCIQRNGNATDVDVMTSDDALSVSRSYILDSQMTQLPVKQAKVIPRGEVTRAAKAAEAACANKHGGLGATCTSGAWIRSKSLLLRSKTPDGFPRAVAGSPAMGRAGLAPRCSHSSVRLTLIDSPEARDSSTVSSLLVPLTAHTNQSNLHLLIDESAKNEQTTQETQGAKMEPNGCNVEVASTARDPKDLLAGSGISYWNAYEYQDFRQLQHGQSHVFDPMMDPYLHRESIILDSYNRLTNSHPRFRMPASMYHVR